MHKWFLLAFLGFTITQGLQAFEGKQTQERVKKWLVRANCQKDICPKNVFYSVHITSLVDRPYSSAIPFFNPSLVPYLRSSLKRFRKEFYQRLQDNKIPQESLLGAYWQANTLVGHHRQSFASLWSLVEYMLPGDAHPHYQSINRLIDMHSGLPYSLEQIFTKEGLQKLQNSLQEEINFSHRKEGSSSPYFQQARIDLRRALLMFSPDELLIRFPPYILGPGSSSYIDFRFPEEFTTNWIKNPTSKLSP